MIQKFEFHQTEIEGLIEVTPFSADDVRGFFTKDYSQDNVKKGVPFVQVLIQRGVLREQDPEVINGVLHAIMLLRLHKEELGKDLFPKIMDEIIDCIAEGLTKPVAVL